MSALVLIQVQTFHENTSFFFFLFQHHMICEETFNLIIHKRILVISKLDCNFLLKNSTLKKEVLLLLLFISVKAIKAMKKESKRL
jgi:hypothetical protein